LLLLAKKIKAAPLGMKKVPEPLNMKVNAVHSHLGKAIHKLKQEQAKHEAKAIGYKLEANEIAQAAIKNAKKGIKNAKAASKHAK
jgi:hypothetical protein